MLRCVILALAAASAWAGVWPEQLGKFSKRPILPVTVEGDRRVWDEFGFQAAEGAEYSSGSSKFTATAYRFKDPTGAFAFFDARRPASARASLAAAEAYETRSGLMIAHGNYVVEIDGHKPRAAELRMVLAGVGGVDESPLPALRGYLPDADLIANSQRYILGPASLSSFAPAIPPRAVGFEFGAEGYLGRYRTKAGEAAMAIFSYPTPNIARTRVAEFQKLPGAAVKRSGMLVAVLLGLDGQPVIAETLLSKVNYQAQVMLSETPPAITSKGVGQMMLAIFSLAGFLLLVCIAGGILFAVFRLWKHDRFGTRSAEEAMITLHLTDRETTMRSKG